MLYMDDWDEVCPRNYSAWSTSNPDCRSLYWTKPDPYEVIPNQIGCLYDYVAGSKGFANWLSTRKNPGNFKCPSDKDFSEWNWTCGYWFGAGTFEYGVYPGGKEGQALAEFDNPGEEACLIETRQLSYWRGYKIKGHNRRTPVGFLDGHTKSYPILTARELYWFDANVQANDPTGDWEVGSPYYCPDDMYTYYWKYPALHS